MAATITDANFNELVSANQVVVIDFWAEWCGPCRQIGPIIEDVAGEYEGKALIGKLDVDDNPEVTEKYGIRNIPTILLLKDGEVADKIVGATSKTALSEKIDALL